jgi:hypothetical protein
MSSGWRLAARKLSMAALAISAGLRNAGAVAEAKVSYL